MKSILLAIKASKSERKNIHLRLAWSNFDVKSKNKKSKEAGRKRRTFPIFSEMRIKGEKERYPLA